MQKTKQSKSSASSQGRGGKSSSMPKQKKSGVKTGTKSSPVAQFSKFQGIGIQKAGIQVISYLGGYIYVGNGTLGATDSVYYQNVGKTFNFITGSVPILPGDTNVGATYVSDQEKYYSRVRYHRIRAHVISLNPATSNQMMAVIAPIRGEGSSIQTTSSSGAAAAFPLDKVVATTSEKPLASYESRVLDMTPFIAGGTGPKQNEFSAQRNQQTAAYVGNVDLNDVSPCGFLVSGTNATTSLRGTQTHMIVIEMHVEFLDFMGGVSQSYPALVSTVEHIARKDPKRFVTMLKQLCNSSWTTEQEKHAEEFLLQYSGNCC